VSHNWSYVIAGYSITTVTLGAYFVRVRQRARRIRRALTDNDRS
jgi:hypothetical protein